MSWVVSSLHATLGNCESSISANKKTFIFAFMGYKIEKLRILFDLGLSMGNMAAE